jgi:hypothetical protein
LTAIRIFDNILTAALFLMLITLTLLAGCAGKTMEPEIKIHLDPIIDMARDSICADMSNRLFLIDGTMVFWERSGDCPDNSFSQTLFGSSIDQVICRVNDSIAGPQWLFNNDDYRDMFDIMISNLDKSDLGLGPGHVVEQIEL